MKTQIPNTDAEVITVAHLNMDIFRRIAPNIDTDEVVITGKQVEHITYRHPGDYEKYQNYIPQIIEEPDYVFRDAKPATAIVIRSFVEEGQSFELVVRLHLPSDPEGFKNSVITFLRTKEKRIGQYVRNREIVYRRE